MKIFLLGLPGSGKTTLGKAVAKVLGIPFIDLDEEVEKKSGMRIQEIFRVHKEDHFRKLESTQLRTLCASKNEFVLATGGGTPCFLDNMALINQSGTSIFLDVSSRIIAERILKTDHRSRPLFADVRPDNLKDAIEFMRSQRLTYYRQAHFNVGPDKGAEEIVALLKKADLR